MATAPSTSRSGTAARGGPSASGASPRPVGGVSVPRALVAAAALVALALSPAPALADGGTIVSEGGRRTLALSGSEVRTDLALPDAFVIAESDTVSVDEVQLVRGDDYLIDYERSVVSFESVWDDSASVVITYHYVPLTLETLYRHAVLESLRELPAGFAETARLLDPTEDKVVRQEPSSLRVGGAKTFGITMGPNRDPSLEQSLRLDITGQITRDVAVSAYLTDQSTPLVPEGDTEDLRALDQVLIEIEGEKVSATMGDYVLDVAGGSLAHFRRDLSGATVEVGGDRMNLLLAGARTAGEFTTTTFRGIDGKQGAYLLTDRHGATGITVVAGSERVWLDGEKLRRGRDNHYVIDYVAGELEFTEFRPITSDNEITVDYEYVTGEYERDLYSARGIAGVGRELLRLGASYFREADDRGSSASALSQEQIDILRAAGDDIELARDDGIDSVGVGFGDYDPVPGEHYFEYVGEDEGAYELSFERSEEGDYNYEFLEDYETFAYVHAVAGSSSYRLGRTLALPSDHALVAADTRLELGETGFVEAEAALSDFDLNTFSDLDDEDNLGNAQTVLASLPLGGLLPGEGTTLDLGVHARRVAGNFEAVSRFREVRYEEKWALEGLAVPKQELMIEGRSALTLGGGGRLGLAYALLERGDVVDSQRAEFDLEARPSENSRVWGMGRYIDLTHTAIADSAIGRVHELYRGGVEYLAGQLKPAVAFRHDSRTEANVGERYDEYEASLERVRDRTFSFGVRYAYRETERLRDSRWGKFSTTRTQEYRIGLVKTELLGVEGGLTRRDIEVEPGLTESGTRYDLVNVRLSHRSFEGGLRGEIRYAVTSNEVEEKEKEIHIVDGVVITRIVSTGRYIPVTDLTAGMNWDLVLRGGAASRAGLPEPTAWKRFLSALAFESDLKLREMTTTDDKRSLYLLHPDVIQGEDTVRGEITGRHVMRYTEANGSLSVRTTFATRDGLDQTYANTTEEWANRHGTLDVKVSRTGGTTYRMQGDLGTRDRRAEGVGDSYRIDEGNVLAEVSVRRVGGVDARLTASIGRQDEAIDAITVDISRITPAVTYRLRGRGTLTANVSRIDVRSSTSILPTYLADGRPPGVTIEWRVTGDYRFNRWLTGSLSYFGERRGGSEAHHTVDLKVNAFF